jgi:hypothetical protein
MWESLLLSLARQSGRKYPAAANFFRFAPERESIAAHLRAAMNAVMK